MKEKIIIYIAILFTFIGIEGQINPYGKPFVINYPPEITKGTEQNWAVVQDKRGVIYVGNNDKGVLEYDGSEWRSIPITNNSIVRSLACAEDNTIYVGAVSELGYLAPDAVGSMKYHSLTPLLDSAERSFTDIWKTYVNDGRVIFHSQKNVYIYFPEEKKFSIQNLGRHALFGFHENNKYYVGVFTKGLMVLENDTSLVLAKGGDYYIKHDILGLTSYDKDHLLIASAGYGLSLYNVETGDVNDKFSDPVAENYLGLVFHLSRLSTGDFLASTGGNGLIVIDNQGHIKEIIGKLEGIQNSTLYNSYEATDTYPFPQVWTANDIGVSKIDLHSPLRMFDEEYGYQGLIHAIGSINGRLYIGTANGIYYKTSIDSKAQFKKTGEFYRAVWDIKKITLDNGQSRLLAIGDEGLMEITPENQVRKLDNLITGIVNEEEKIFWGYKIMIDPYKQNVVYLSGQASITSLIYKNNNWHYQYAIESPGGEVRSIARSKDKIWFVSELNGLGCLTPVDKSARNVYFDTEHGLPDKDENKVFQIGKDILIGTQSGIYRINDFDDTTKFYKDTILNQYLLKGTNGIHEIYSDPSGTLWISYKNDELGWNISSLDPLENGTYRAVTKPFFILENFSSDAFHGHTHNDVWFSISNKLYHYDKSKVFPEGTFKAYIRKVTVDDDTVIFNGAHARKNSDGSYSIRADQDRQKTPLLKYADNNITFRWSAPYFKNEEKIEFSYYLDGFSNSWSDWERVFQRDFTNLPHGDYTFKVKARNIFFDESLEDTYSFTILRPWYLTFYAFIGYLIAAVFIVFVIIKLYTRRLKNENIRLEGIIQERTAEIRKQKEELTDSIEYASRIQRAVLPPIKMLEKHNLEHFILFRPRDIVSGDFYWFGKNNNKIYIVAADCTGHGVPGAFMSMLGISFLEEIVVKSGVPETNKILDALRNHVITSLRQTGKSIEESTKDGMDLAMVSIDEKTKKIQFSGAYNPLYVVRALTGEEKGVLNEGKELDLDRGALYNETHLLYQVRADHMPIGISEKDHEFSAHELEFEYSNTIYMFSDGFVDQFGGPMGKKFMTKNFKKLLLDMQGLSMDQQKEMLNDSLISWMGDISQIDDVLVIGIRIQV
ncbi:MAG: SpoIIE family protein phosphatase [Bacteroidales bacterium]|nr:SpoIIE family protein phosphatase [Bacteroidales bacterium]